MLKNSLSLLNYILKQFKLKVVFTILNTYGT